MDMISVRQAPELAPRAIAYFQRHWATAETLMMYEDAINRSLGAVNPLPQWYLLMENDQILGCAGLITNDFISRGELYPWLCALYVEEAQRGRGHGAKLIEHVAAETRRLGFPQLHLCTDLEGYYERSGFVYNGLGYHPWGEASRVYSRAL
ncbi:TPA: GNAT family N-acetyltransferase [Serratia marcescens]|uniref:GNAT family N-acetyltransferase n=1 Tax=Serratia marcescens TaxID=615 RepID=UPI0018D3EA13|nr:GNAT family N-acetyltransferase [Serratia marcescens]MBH1898133.1 GNAT family N-acetyltransferase [Serratia marcescens]MBH2692543.1 GNAT family N-acetyltransferase [Serratia marcescens]MBH2736929.1 GNAT family N-acetyltransferase [Serratia marcescens]MBH2830125.1 GNAT family N-acetyltransferase [Serratia marcescens]MBH3224590.1 GNAT family N-acetyltransferase [Serratia marcescens]